jgi:DNA-binding PadR family transcriptional regulator
MQCHRCKQHMIEGKCPTCQAILTRVKAGDRSIKEIWRRTKRQANLQYEPTRRILEKMEYEGLVTGHIIEEDVDRQRKQYRLTEKGDRYLQYTPPYTPEIF